MLYYVENCRGAALIEADDELSAEEYILREYGREGQPTELRAATKADQSWVRGMGGRIHKAPPSC